MHVNFDMKKGTITYVRAFINKKQTQPLFNYFMYRTRALPTEHLGPISELHSLKITLDSRVF